jgi:hypothetical protein
MILVAFDAGADLLDQLSHARLAAGDGRNGELVRSDHKGPAARVAQRHRHEGFVGAQGSLDHRRGDNLLHKLAVIGRSRLQRRIGIGQGRLGVGNFLVDLGGVDGSGASAAVPLHQIVLLAEQRRQRGACILASANCLGHVGIAGILG